MSIARRFLDWVGFRLSRSTYVDGLWVGAFSGGPDAEVLGRLCDALLLIKTYDQSRYKRILNDVERIWGNMLPASQAVWDKRQKACVLDSRFILSSPLEFIASTIVHEATHARLMRCGIAYGEELRHRVERACFRQELAFALRIPGGGELQEDVRSRLSSETFVPAYWTNDEFHRRREAGEVEMLRYVGIPDWFFRFLLWFRRRGDHRDN